MTSREFLNALTGSDDLLQIFLDLLEEAEAEHCVIGGLAVNAYAEPVVSLDLDVVVATDRVDRVAELATERGLRVERFPHSVNLAAAGSDLRIQLQTDPRYQAFVPRAETREVLGYPLRVAVLGDVLQGKLWAYLDESRRPSKRQKDLADIARLTEDRPELFATLPAKVRERLA